MSSNLTIIRMITNLVHGKLGQDHPKSQEIIDKYTAVSGQVEFSHTLDDMAKFQKIISDVQDEMKELGPLNLR